MKEGRMEEGRRRVEEGGWRREEGKVGCIHVLNKLCYLAIYVCVCVCVCVRDGV